nr:hypothetical protein [Tanacetum cinerariifolium]
MSDQLDEEKNIVKIKQMTISELKECLRKKDFENEHLKSKVVDFTTVQDLQAIGYQNTLWIDWVGRIWHQSCGSYVVGLSAIIMSLIMSLKCEHGLVS